MELEIKHLAAYLPWRVKVSPIHVLTHGNGIGSIMHILTSKSSIYKLRLHPLSDLTSPKNGIDGITWFDDICWNFFDSRTPDNYECSKIVLNELLQASEVQMDTYYGLVEYLLENHFDIFNLIQNNLAIDINAIKQ